MSNVDETALRDAPIHKTDDDYLADAIHDAIYTILIYGGSDGDRAQAGALFIGKTVMGLLAERGYLKDGE